MILSRSPEVAQVVNGGTWAYSYERAAAGDSVFDSLDRRLEHGVTPKAACVCAGGKPRSASGHWQETDSASPTHSAAASQSRARICRRTIEPRCAGSSSPKRFFIGFERWLLPNTTAATTGGEAGGVLPHKRDNWLCSLRAKTLAGGIRAFAMPWQALVSPSVAPPSPTSCARRAWIRHRGEKRAWRGRPSCERTGP